jgi:hypothetical protein
MLGHRDWAKTTPRSDPAWVVFGALLLFHAWHNYVWLGNDWPFFFITDRVPMERAWQWQKIILRDDWLPSILQRFYRDEDSGIYNLTVGAVYLFSASVRTTILSTNLPYLAIGIWFTYRLGARMAGSAWGGVFSAAIFGLIPSVYAASRRVSHEFAVMCLTVMAVWFLLTSEGFLKRRQSILFGLTVGWGMMIKYVMAVGLAGPVALCLLRAFFPQGKVPLAIWRTEKALRLANLGWAVLAAVAIMGIKYSNPVSVWHYAMRPQWERSSEPWYTWENLRVTTVGLVEDHFGLLFFLVFCFGVAIFLSRKWVEGPNKAVLLAWFLVPWLSIILMSHHKWDRGRYLLPVIPALALMAGIGWSRFAGGRYRWARLGIVVLLGLTQFYDFSFNDRPKGRTLAGLKYYGPRDPLLKASTGFGPSMERRIARILSHMKGKRTVVLTSQEELLDFEMWRSFHAHFREARIHGSLRSAKFGTKAPPIIFSPGSEPRTC